jgi:ADP-heptose:LPS heptosyltransferase
MKTKAVLCVRMSAIGDLVMLGRSLSEIKRAGVEPLLLTHPGLIDLAKRFTAVTRIVTFDGNTVQCFARANHSSTGDGETQEWSLSTEAKVTGEENALIKTWLCSLAAIIDFQVTHRSRRALSALRALGLPSCPLIRAKKDRLHRLRLLLSARFRGQNISGSKLTINKATELATELGTESPHRVFQSYNRATRELLGRICADKNELQLSKDWNLLEVNKGIEGIAGHRPDCVLFTGASLPLKRWPHENAMEFIETLLAAGKKVTLAGGKAEQQAAAQLAAACPGTADLTGALSLGETIDLIAQARFVVTPDSFPGHVCDLVKTPCIILFGATSTGFGFVPPSEHAWVAQHKTGCSPCSRHGRGKCRFGNNACMRQLTGKAIALQVLRRLES